MVQDPKQALLDMIDSGPLPSERQSLMDMIDLGGPPKPHSRRTGSGKSGGGLGGAIESASNYIAGTDTTPGLIESGVRGAEVMGGRALDSLGRFGERSIHAVAPGNLTRAEMKRREQAAGEPGRDLTAYAEKNHPAAQDVGHKLMEGAGGIGLLVGASAINPGLGLAGIAGGAAASIEDRYAQLKASGADEATATQGAMVQGLIEIPANLPIFSIGRRLAAAEPAAASLLRKALDAVKGGSIDALGPASAAFLGQTLHDKLTPGERVDLLKSLKASGETLVETGPLFILLHGMATGKAPEKAPGQPKAESPGGSSPEVVPEPSIKLETPPGVMPSVELGKPPEAPMNVQPEAAPVEAVAPAPSPVSSPPAAEAVPQAARATAPVDPVREARRALPDSVFRRMNTLGGKGKLTAADLTAQELSVQADPAAALRYAEWAAGPDGFTDESANWRKIAKFIRKEWPKAAEQPSQPLSAETDSPSKLVEETPEERVARRAIDSARSAYASGQTEAQREATYLASKPVARPPPPDSSPTAGEGVRPPRKPQAEPVEAPPPEPSVAPSGEPAKAQEAQGVTATKNAETDRQRAARNLPPAMEAAKRDFEGVWDSAMKQIDEDPGAPERLVQDLAEKPRAATDAENALLLHRQIELQTEHSKVADQLLRASEAGDTARLGELQKRAGRVSDQLLQLYEVGRSAGTETGRGLNARKMLAAEDFSLATMETALRVEQKGARLSPEQTATIKELHEKIAATQKAFDEYRARQEKAPRAPKPDSKARVLDFMDAQARAARERIRQRGTRAMAGLDPADLADRVIVGADFLAKDIAKFAEWSTAMVGEFGEAIKPHLDDIYSQAKAYLDAAPKKAGALQAFKTRTKGAIEKTETKLEAGDFEPAPKRQPLALDKEGVTLKANLEEVKRRYQRELLRARYKNRTTGEKWKDWGKEALNLPKALMTAYDFSAVLRQGAFFSFAHPIKAAKSLPDMFAATLSERKALEIDVALRARPNAQLGETAKLELTRHGDDIGKHEEAIRSAWSDKIPGIKASNRAFITFLNMQRATAFDALVDAVPGGATPEQARAIASLVNIGTGRGEPGKFAATVSAASNVLWSPRLLLSRFQLLAGQPLYKGDMVTRRLVAQEYARSLAGLGAVYALARLAGADIETDPRSSDFGKLRFGSTRVDPLAGLSQVSVLLSRLGLGETKTGKGEIVPIRGERKYGQASGYEVMARFLRSKLSPTLGTSIDIVSGENMIGEPTTPQSVAKNALVPLSFQDILKAMEDQGVERGAALAILSTLGMGLQVHEKKVK